MDNRPYKIDRPDGVTRFVIEHADHTYLIFNRKNDELFCTKQNRKIDQSAEGLIHNCAEVCNRCRRGCVAVIPKESRYGRKGLTEYGRVLWFVHGDEEVYAQLDLYEIDYTAGYAEVTFVPDQQFCISDKGCQKYSYEAVYTQGEWIYTWNPKKNFRLTQPQGTGCAYTLPRFYKTIMYDDYDLVDLNVGPLKYANMYILASLVRMNPYNFIELLQQWAKYPATELLYKAGFTNIIKSRAEGIKTRKINWRGKNLAKILKSTPAEIKQIREANLDIGGLEAYKEAKKLFPTVLPAFASQLTGYGAMDSLKRIAEQLPAEKAIKYLQENNVHIRSYEDHLELVAKTGSKRNSGNLFPQDFHRKHEELAELYERNKRQHDDIGIKKTADKVATLEYSSDRLQITAAKNSKELAEESSILGHCVRTYADRVAKGKTYIFFVREKTQPDKPYYTLELTTELKIAQCRGEHNCAMTPEVREFVQEWEKFIAKKKKGAA